MNFQSMEYFAVLAEERNFSKAAKRLFITQQTLSAHIASLEDELGCKLVVRQTPIELTYAGDVFLRYAKQYNASMADMQKEFSDIAKNPWAKLHVGINYSRSMIFMPDILSNVHRKMPNIEVILYENTDLISKLVDGQLDLIITNTKDKLPKLCYEKFFDEGTSLVVSRTLLDNLGINPADVTRCVDSGNVNALRTCPFIRNEDGGVTSRMSKQIFENSNFTPFSAFEITNTNVILSMCLRSLGAGFVPKSMAKYLLNPDDRDKLYIFDLPETMSYPINFSYVKGNYQWSVITDFIRVARETFNTL